MKAEKANIQRKFEESQKRKFWKLQNSSHCLFHLCIGTKISVKYLNEPYAKALNKTKIENSKTFWTLLK